MRYRCNAGKMELHISSKNIRSLKIFPELVRNAENTMSKLQHQTPQKVPGDEGPWPVCRQVASSPGGPTKDSLECETCARLPGSPQTVFPSLLHTQTQTLAIF